MIADVLEVGSKKTLQLEPVCLQKISDIVLRDLSNTFYQTKPKIFVDLDPEFDVLGNFAKVERLFENILSNAFEVVQPADSITISSKKYSNNQRLKIIINNTGSYIADVENIFTPYFTRGKRAGTGLGLAIVKKIVLDHGGEIMCRSSRENGTEFEINLPAIRKSS